jgi:hypothetical protein
MNKLFSVISVLILSICVLSCSKDKDKEEELTPIAKEELESKAWSISEAVISITISLKPSAASAAEAELNKMFKKDDKYLFNGGTCQITRTGSNPYSLSYKIEGGYLIFEGNIKFKTDVSEDEQTLTLTANDAEIKEVNIVKEKVIAEAGEEYASMALNAIKGNMKLVLKRD